MDIVMPRLTDSMEEGTVLSWLKADGDRVAIGDELVEIETDKASMVYESDLEGVLKILVGEGETRPIGETIATVGDRSETGDATAEPESRPAPETASASESETPADPPPRAAPETSTVPGPGAGRIKASPLAKRIAADRGIDLRAVDGSGPNGRIVKADLTQTETKPAPEPAPSEGRRPKETEAKKGEVEIVELTRLQQTISRRMAESKATAPHFYLRTEVDMSRAVEVRAAFKAAASEGEVVPSFNDMVVKATAMALRHHPRANGSYRDGRIELYSRINVGIAVAAENSLVVPTIGDADHKDLREIAAESRRLAERVRSGEITPPELAGGTFSISNLGMFGVRGFDAVINSGQAGILAVGEIAERPVVRDGEIASAHLMEISLSCDHRILYGADGAEFLAEVKSNLEEPGLLA
ncbi:MAG TPA: dihydrolipoamide acetyltransferase family protein [Solirubrobacterales bacterium]|nr:dihydrolipoamide acetyltransferase family protein [Solirubrobacterales bacterium]